MNPIMEDIRSRAGLSEAKYSEARLKTLPDQIKDIAVQIIKANGGKAYAFMDRNDQPLTTGYIHTRKVDFSFDAQKSQTGKIITAIKKFLKRKGIGPMAKGRRSGEETTVRYEDIGDLRVKVGIGWRGRNRFGWVAIEVYDAGSNPEDPV
jgi:hypothetical protein